MEFDAFYNSKIAAVNSYFARNCFNKIIDRWKFLCLLKEKKFCRDFWYRDFNQALLIEFWLKSYTISRMIYFLLGTSKNRRKSETSVWQFRDCVGSANRSKFHATGREETKHESYMLVESKIEKFIFIPHTKINTDSTNDIGCLYESSNPHRSFCDPRGSIIQRKYKPDIITVAFSMTLHNASEKNRKTTH